MGALEEDAVWGIGEKERLEETKDLDLVARNSGSLVRRFLIGIKLFTKYNLITYRQSRIGHLAMGHD